MKAEANYSILNQVIKQNFIFSFSNIVKQLETTSGLKKEETFRSLQGMWDNFSQICDILPPPMSNSLTPQKNSI